MLFVEAEFVVGFLVHQTFEFRRVFYNHLDNPGFERVAVYELGVSFESEIYLGDFAAYGSEKVGGSFAAFDCAEFFAGFELFSVFGGVDIGDCAKLLCCVF